jgi:hypothetical protein
MARRRNRRVGITRRRLFAERLQRLRREARAKWAQAAAALRMGEREEGADANAAACAIEAEILELQAAGPAGLDLQDFAPWNG